ncbi:hemerythrin domain-containing protein [Azospirillum sp. RWY-5-1]|uniref:Hemerythrin domain-containing protein n=1 Tax=Azospirillum oleiclasticum TaxID=2735135 RepID=A0ABX2T563_9PROT|nr:hemerythrin domain-containing protein [Azospirillum oleiclasticum]NYZ11265.1 hemerythrin domain-containing protein [Azospirillum oleiclasticum]NYZ18426.1 hemerythrin domain-containing protein [Azospirillum oleiclasticum]
MTTPPTLQRIVAEHKAIAAMMNVMEAEIIELEAKGAFDIDLVRLILSYMAEYPDRFHHPKEELLFAAATAKRPSFATLAAAIHDEHENLPGATEDLLKTLDVIEIGQSMPLDEVLGALKSYVVNQRAHMAAEKDQLFPALLEILGADDWTVAEAQAAAIEDPLAGGSDPGPYRRLQDLILAAV